MDYLNITDLESIKNLTDMQKNENIHSMTCNEIIGSAAMDNSCQGCPSNCGAHGCHMCPICNIEAACSSGSPPWCCIGCPCNEERCCGCSACSCSVTNFCIYNNCIDYLDYIVENKKRK